MGQALVLHTGLLGIVESCIRFQLVLSVRLIADELMQCTHHGKVEEGDRYSGTCRTQS